MDTLLSILGAILLIFIVIVVHELGHFLVARRLGVTVLRFSIGFGRPIVRWFGKSGTEYAIGYLPLGGYVKMLGEGDDEVSEKLAKGAYNRKPVLSRIAIVLAGPMMNFLLAIAMFWIIYAMGLTYIKPIVGQVLPASVAAQAQLPAKVEIVAIDQQPTHSWQQVLMALIKRLGSKGELSLAARPMGAPSAPVQTYTLDLSRWTPDQSDPEFLRSLGIVPYEPSSPAIVSQVLQNSPAAQMGLQAGDLVTHVDGKRLSDMPAVLKTIQAKPDQSIQLTVQRGTQTLILTGHTKVRTAQSKALGYLGFLPKPPQWPESFLYHTDYSGLTSLGPALKETWTLTAFNFIALKKMLVGDISLKTLGGPITIFRSAGQASRSGVRIYLGFVAFISITLGFVNLLPIPGLDGGHLLFYVIEMVFRRPVPERYQAMLLKIGILLLVLLMVQATINDVLRMF